MGSKISQKHVSLCCNPMLAKSRGNLHAGISGIMFPRLAENNNRRMVRSPVQRTGVNESLRVPLLFSFLSVGFLLGDSTPP